MCAERDRAARATTTRRRRRAARVCLLLKACCCVIATAHTSARPPSSSLPLASATSPLACLGVGGNDHRLAVQRPRARRSSADKRLKSARTRAPTTTRPLMQVGDLVKTTLAAARCRAFRSAGRSLSRRVLGARRSNLRACLRALDFALLWGGGSSSRPPARPLARPPPPHVRARVRSNSIESANWRRRGRGVRTRRRAAAFATFSCSWSWICHDSTEVESPSLRRLL